MKKTPYYGLFKPEGTDAVDIQNFNDNFDAIDTALHEAADASGDLSKGAVYASVAASRSSIESGNTLGVIVGKIMKWFADMKDAAFAQIANSDDVTSSGYVADARIVKTHGDEIDALNAKNGGLYFGQNSAGKWGYKTSANGTVNPFRNPVGTADTGDVLAGKTFANTASDTLTGAMPNNGDVSQTLTPEDDGSVTAVIPAGYTTGGTITANGATAYAAGKIAATPTKVGSGDGEKSFSVLSIAKNYADLTVANFLIVPTNVYASARSHANLSGYTTNLHPVVAYDSSTATVKVTGVNDTHTESYGEDLDVLVSYDIYVYGIDPA